MEERKAVIRKYVSEGLKVDFLAKLVGISKSTYYYRPRPGKRGRKPDTHTLTCDGRLVSNEVVVGNIQSIISEEFMENGYLKITRELKDIDYKIGKSKTYRLMKENRLLLPLRRKRARQFVRFTQPLALEPFEKLEMDIKFIYIRGERKNALLLSVIDTFTRIVLGWELQYSIRNTHVSRLFNQVIEDWLQPYRPPYDDNFSVTIRSDNDSRFIAGQLKEYLSENFIDQEFILPATPQQNAHIESFHSVLESLVCSKYDFETIGMARETLSRFYPIYNNRRTIGALQYLPPTVFMTEWYKGNIGVIMRKKGNHINQKFFFGGQRPKWRSVLPEETLGGEMQM